MTRTGSHHGFTLIELMLVVVILGILAALVIPKFSNASATARASMLADDARIIRVQITVFKSQHNDVAPGYPGLNPTATPSESTFLLHMTQASNPAGGTAVPGTVGYQFGPYLSEFPTNPVNGKATVNVIPDTGTVPASADDSYGWFYQPYTMTLKPDSIGADDAGKLFIDY